MLELKPIIAFVITTKPEEAISFYRDKLGFKLVGNDEFALVFDANGTMIRVVKLKAEQFRAAPHTVLGWRVADASRAAAELKQRGISFERYPGMGQDQDGIWTSPSGARVAWFKDPEGNVLSISQFPQ
jgi:catechol 2,3-dioxygenase-like lactoylglutathione lyase family enzyme